MTLPRVVINALPHSTWVAEAGSVPLTRLCSYVIAQYESIPISETMRRVCIILELILHERITNSDSHCTTEYASTYLFLLPPEALIISNMTLIEVIHLVH
jgi:hypothetical protein